MIVLAHLSDTHFDGGPRNFERSARVMAYVNDLRHQVDAILVTGDIADDGLTAQYDEAVKVLTSDQPVLLCPGNHDVREAYREVLLREPASAGPVNRVHRVGGAIIAMCDSSIPGRDDGHLDDETLSWLDAVLDDAGDAPAFVCFHHPPVLVHNPALDEIRQFGAERLAEMIERHPNVVALLCGHAHTAAASTFAGRPLLVAPGIASTLRLPWEHGPVLDYDLPPAIAFHVLDDDRRLITHYRVVPERVPRP